MSPARHRPLTAPRRWAACSSRGTTNRRRNRRVVEEPAARLTVPARAAFHTRGETDAVERPRTPSVVSRDSRACGHPLARDRPWRALSLELRGWHPVRAPLRHVATVRRVSVRAISFRLGRLARAFARAGRSRCVRPTSASRLSATSTRVSFVSAWIVSSAEDLAFHDVRLASAERRRCEGRSSSP